MKAAESFAGLPDTVIRQAVDVLRLSGVVAFPTETFYGLAVDPYDERALRKLFRLKRREQHKPILLLISDIEQLVCLVDSVPEKYKELMSKYWPGPLTLIFPAKKDLPYLVTGGTGTVGVRLTPHPVAKRLISCMGKPLTATSANVSKEAPATTAQEVKASFGDSLDYIIDGGTTEGGLCSTVIGLNQDALCLERPGRIVIPGVVPKRIGK